MHPQAVMDTRTAARRLGVTYQHVSYLVRAGRLPVAFRGSGKRGAIFIPADAVEQLAAKRERARSG